MRLLLQAWDANALHEWANTAVIATAVLFALIAVKYGAVRLVLALSRRTATRVDDVLAQVVAATRVWLLAPVAVYAGALAVETRSGSVVARLAGAGDVEIASGSGSIRVAGATAGLTAMSRSGRIDVDGSPGGNWSVESGSGSVTLRLPADAAFVLDAASRSGQVSTDHPVAAGAVEKRRIAGVVVRDWPGTPVRGMTEGFYGTPWTLRQRLAQLDFMGRTKQNRYLYAPGDDQYRQTRWRAAYPPAQRSAFRALAERARRNHVTLAWAVAPGQAMCLSSDRDLKALIHKLDSMWGLGVRAFQLQFQDVSYSEWHCEQDAAAFGSGPGAAARAGYHDDLRPAQRYPHVRRRPDGRVDGRRNPLPVRP